MSVSKLIVPDDVLDVLLCDNCHKYLSVKPIRVGGSQILCGRCIGEENVEYCNSQYEKFADYALFKCINQYEGCNKLLSCNEVLYHEEDCQYSCDRCILCLQKIPTYMLPYHVINKHIESYLTENYFCVELVHQKVNNFFYRIDNNLFFIRQFFDENQKLISLEFVGVGQRNVDISRIHIKYGESDIQLESKTCSENMDTMSNVWGSKYVFSIIDAGNRQLAKIRFDIKITRSSQFVQLETEPRETELRKTELWETEQEDDLSKFCKIVDMIHLEEGDGDNLSLESLVQKYTTLYPSENNTSEWSRRLTVTYGHHPTDYFHAYITSGGTSLMIERMGSMFDC